ncbi:hypothetical protein NIES3806_15640 [Microcystis aeruginosa NIES-3806]|uniref:Uncharacterized protein n=1 Tax=Microcystis aeruginosa NIES-2549 TaxID=1641812 RepID=A0A0F6U0X8_MICAE|nr:hypothetical protein [Microcystis aeruginosa]AKE62412.1 hypothetical protein MYAER_0048 [Microcystis aeruginosa NIES-2549]AOC50802.1 hypothetical protein amyaer_0047 [Microcystis aeruginosa NIES-2481]GCL54227.1 hypothetical protein NIES3806_15640 [Microcystis aeruginosa NIES-3806]
MRYTYQYIKPTEIRTRTQDIWEISKDDINAETAKKIGVICLRAIEIYRETINNIRNEKSALKYWVREARSQARGHGRILRYKGSSTTRASMNADISNTNDRVLNELDNFLSTAQRNLPIVQDKLNKCLRIVSLDAIRSYESTFLQDRQKLQEYQQNKSFQLLTRVSAVLIPVVIIIYLFSKSANLTLIIGAIFAVILIDIILIKNVDKYLQKKIDVYENAQRAVADLKLKKKLKDTEARSFQTKLNPEIVARQEAEARRREREKAEAELIKALALELEDEYIIFDNACLTFEIEADNWYDLARMLQEKDKAQDNTLLHTNENLSQEFAGYDPSDVDYLASILEDKLFDFYAAREHFSSQAEDWLNLAQDLFENNSKLAFKLMREDWSIKITYSPEELQNRFSSFQEAKDFFGVSARSWMALAEKLNSRYS